MNGLKTASTGFVIGLVVMTWVAGPITVEAHEVHKWFDPVVWEDFTDVDYMIDDSIPGDEGSNFEDRVHDAAGHWNSVTGVANFKFKDGGNGNPPYGPPCNWRDASNVDVRVFFHDIEVVANSAFCFVYHQQQQYTDIHSARLTFDSSEGWYKGTGNPPAGQWAVEDIGAHEWGHLTGTFIGGNYGGHWPLPPSNQCSVVSSESDWTMCPGNITAAGHKHRIPLEPHDVDTFQDFY